MVPMYGVLKPFYDTCRGLRDIQVSAEGVEDQVSRLFIWHNVFWKKILIKCLLIWHFLFYPYFRFLIVNLPKLSDQMRLTMDCKNSKVVSSSCFLMMAMLSNIYQSVLDFFLQILFCQGL